MDKKHRGAWTELLASAWLLQHGYEVFRNVSQHGAADLIAIKGEVVRRIDVKTVGMNMNKNTGWKSVFGITSPTAEGVEPLYVARDGFVSFSVVEIFEHVTKQSFADWKAKKGSLHLLKSLTLAELEAKP